MQWTGIATKDLSSKMMHRNDIAHKRATYLLYNGQLKRNMLPLRLFPALVVIALLCLQVHGHPALVARDSIETSSADATSTSTAAVSTKTLVAGDSTETSSVDSTSTSTAAVPTSTGTA